jgi:hypothetical protein
MNPNAKPFSLLFAVKWPPATAIYPAGGSGRVGAAPVPPARAELFEPDDGGLDDLVGAGILSHEVS